MRNEKDIEKIKNGLVNKYNPDKIFVFGSQAKEDADENSDIDICIILDIDDKDVKSFRRNIRSYIHRKKGLNYLDKPVDIILYTPRQFEQISKRKGTLANLIANEGVLLSMVADSTNYKDWVERAKEDLKAAEIILADKV